MLIKAVVQAIPSYTMSIFRLPAGLCHRLRSMIMQFGGVLRGMRNEFIGENGVCCASLRFREEWVLEILFVSIKLL